MSVLCCSYLDVSDAQDISSVLGYWSVPVTAPVTAESVSVVLLLLGQVPVTRQCQRPQWMMELLIPRD